MTDRFGRLAAGLVAAALVAGCGVSAMGGAQREPRSTLAPATVQPVSPSRPLPTPSLAPATPLPPTALPPLVDPALDLLAGPVSVPLQLLIPALAVAAPVLGVGITSANSMDAPKGAIDDPIWQAAYWYRGSSIPGDSGTAVIAGHVNDPLSRPAIFAHLEDLTPGDSLLLHDTRTGLDLHYLVTQVERYSRAQSAEPAVLAQIYGAGPAAGLGPQPSPDGLAHLTLITCSGAIVDGEFDHHIVVYAVLSP